MATEVSASFQDTTGGPINAYYAAQNQRMSMMEKAQTLKQQEMASRIMQAEQQEWEVQAPIRQKKAELSIAETGAKLYAANAAIEEENKLVQELPSIMELFKNATVIERNEDGELDYEKSTAKWSQVLSEVSKYGNSDRGKQLFTAAKVGLQEARMSHADQLSYKIAELKSKNTKNKAQVVVNEEGKTVLEYTDPQTGEVREGDVPKSYRSAEEEARAAGMIKQAESDVKVSSEFLEALSSQAEAARLTRSQVKSLRDAYKAGAKGGTLQSYNTAIRGFASDVLGITDPKLSAQRVRDMVINQATLGMRQVLMKGTGAVSNIEGQWIQQAYDLSSMDDKTALIMLEVMDKVAERSIILQQKRRDYERQGITGIALTRKLEEDRDSIPIGIEDLAGKLTGGSTDPASGKMSADDIFNSVMKKRK